LARTAIAAALAIGATGAHAELILLGPADLNGTGLGAVNTVLTMTSPANTSTESASVNLNTSGALNVTGDAIAINQTRTLAQIGTTSAANLRIVFNASEPANADSITLSNLVLTLQPASGATTPAMNFHSGAFVPITLNATQQGIGNAGYVFGLNAVQAAQAQAAIAAGASVLGLQASATNATGGNETFFATTAAGLPPLVGPVPEPATLALLGSGFLAMGGIALRRRKR
jgi:hypothetical protein